jgi:glycerate kinase
VHVLVAPDRFASVRPSGTVTLTARHVAASLADGWLTYDSNATVERVPLSDGGPGFLDALLASGVGTRRDLTWGPVVQTADGTVYVEAGLTSGATAELLRGVLADLGPASIVVAVGGGAGAGADLSAGTRSAGTGSLVTLSAWPPEVPLQVAADPVPSLPALGGTRVSGTQVVVDAVRLAARCATADLVLTAETIFDAGSLQGRVPRGAAWAAQRAGRPCVVLAERVLVGRREFASAGVDAAYELPAPDAGGADVADLVARLEASAERVARTWTSGGR